MDTSVAPGVLIAGPQLYDPNFDHSVVLMCEHSGQGAMGLVINRESSISIQTVFESIDLSPPPTDAPPVLHGGPVQPERGWIIHGSRWEGGESLMVAEGIYVSTSRDILEALVEGKGPKPYRLVLGYAGWAPGQLEAEITQGAWIYGKAYADLVFNIPVEERWARTLADLGIDPSQLVDTVGQA